MSVIDHIVAVFERLGSLADGLRRRLSYLLGVAALACAYLAVKVYSVDSALWWNVIKCGVFILPVVIWGVIWFVLGQLRDAPETASSLVEGKDEILQHFSNLNAGEVKGVKGAYGTLKMLSQQDGLEDVMDTISGVSLLINPFFALLALLTFFGLFGLIFTALLVMLF